MPPAPVHTHVCDYGVLRGAPQAGGLLLGAPPEPRFLHLPEGADDSLSPVAKGQREVLLNGGRRGNALDHSQWPGPRGPSPPVFGPLPPETLDCEPGTGEQPLRFQGLVRP